MTFPRVLCAALALVGLGGSAAEDPPYVQFGRRDEPTRFETICRWEIDPLPPALTALGFIAENGGRTCFEDGRGILLVPERNGRCPRPVDMSAGKGERLSYADAAREAVRCLAANSAHVVTDVVIFRPNLETSGADKRFGQFKLDVVALAAYDMLPINHLGSLDDVVCMKAPNARLVALRVRDADIADPTDLLVYFERGTCRELTPPLTGNPWSEYRLSDR